MARVSRLAKGGVYRLTVKDAAGNRETISVTPNHPYLRAANDNGSDMLHLVKLDPGGDWTAAGFLKAGDTLQSATGATLTVVSSTHDKSPTRVYNFEVANLHSYAVGHLQAWVHNAVPSPDLTALTGLIKGATRGGKSISDIEADILLEWGKELKLPCLDHRGTDHFIGGSHIHIKGTGGPTHIKVR